MSPHKDVIDTKFEQYLPQIKEILDTHFGGHDVKVYLYGSRARGEGHSASDIDLAVKASDTLTLELSKAREAFFESHIPYKVDLVNLENIGQELKNSILNEGLIIWEN